MSITPVEINERLFTYFDTCHVISLSAVDWAGFTDRINGNFGWNYPRLNEDGQIEIFICPEVIAHQLRGVDKTTARRYLETIVWMIDQYMSIAWPGGVLDPEEQPDEYAAHVKVENEFYDGHHETMTEVSQIQARALDL